VVDVVDLVDQHQCLHVHLLRGGVGVTRPYLFNG